MPATKPFKVSKPVKKANSSSGSGNDASKSITSLKIDEISQTKPIPKKSAAYESDPNTNQRYWLIKSEPLSRIDPKTGKDVAFPLSSLLKLDKEAWDGVRNFEARNNMLNMAKGDICLFYHSNCPTPGIVGLVEVVCEAHADLLQFDPKSNYFDSKSTIDNPKWWCIDVSFKRRFRHKVSLEKIKSNAKLSEFMLVKRGRLSVIPVRVEEFKEILKMESDGDIEEDIDCEIDKKFIK